MSGVATSHRVAADAASVAAPAASAAREDGDCEDGERGDGERERERQWAATLARSGRYRVLERLEPRACYHPPDGTATQRALYVDVETTGLDHDPIIQLAALPFAYGPACGRVFEVGACEVWYEDPGRPIPPEVTRLTGITDADVAGCRLDDRRVAALAGDAALVVAHNAAFDRPRLERRLPLFAGKPWACSCHDVSWRTEGFESATLGWLAYRQCAAFHDAHRADADCRMGVHLLATALPSGAPVLSALLEAARGRTVRVWAVESPFATRDAFRRRGYRWHPGEGGFSRAWWREVPESGAAAEADWLAAHVYDGPLGAQVQLLDAHVRHSARVGARPLMPWARYAARAAAARTPRAEPGAP